MWLVIQVLSMSKTKLSNRERSDRVLFVTKTKHDNDMTDHIGLVYVENDIELLGPIGPGVVYDETKRR